MWNFNKFKSNIALIEDSGDSITYSDLDLFGKKLVKSVPKRSLVLCLCSNTIASVLGYTSFINLLNVSISLSFSPKHITLCSVAGTDPAIICQWSCSPIGAEASRPERPSCCICSHTLPPGNVCSLCPQSVSRRLCSCREALGS